MDDLTSVISRRFQFDRQRWRTHCTIKINTLRQSSVRNICAIKCFNSIGLYLNISVKFTYIVHREIDVNWTYAPWNHDPVGPATTYSELKTLSKCRNCGGTSPIRDARGPFTHTVPLDVPPNFKKTTSYP